MRWYADNSELKGIRGAQIPDILFLGGFAVADGEEQKLRLDIEGIKRRYGCPRCPIKWNFKGLRSLYRNMQASKLYDRLLKSSKDWRTQIFKCLAQSGVVLILACIESYSRRRTTIKQKKDVLSQYAFSDALMRFALLVKESKPELAQVVLDWPDKGNSEPFDQEYASAFNYGKTHGGKVPYKSGKLMTLPFGDSLLYSNMHHSTMLQVADLIVGATREFVQSCQGSKEDSLGVTCLKEVRDRFLGAPDHILGRGLSVPTRNRNLREAIRKGLHTLLRF